VFGLRVEYASILAQKLPMDVRPLGSGVPTGVSVREIAPDSPAAAAFKKLGDRPERWLVTHVNGAAVGTPAEFYKAAKGQQSVKLTVLDPTEPNRKDREVTLP
jgi:S1-C subfamily serine protease